ncbi:MAG: hypothetical protein WCF30_13435 [Terracidiphilus sp.]
MKIREFLHYEIWSKRTSRRVLVVSTVVLAVLILGLFALNAVNRNWLTPGERKAAKAALIQLDALQDSGPLSNKDFSVRAKQVGREIDEAHRAAWTTRDRIIVLKLMDYQLDIVVMRMQMQRQELTQQRKNSSADFDRKLDELMKSSGTNADGLDRLALHKELD